MLPDGTLQGAGLANDDHQKNPEGPNQKQCDLVAL